ncbi:hypothetical protein A1F99_083500 [Pyrenophora tritici-repentis]|nr:hypothetical protein A1F99_083500 [Pyrenophora tritici-repentis]
MLLVLQLKLKLHRRRHLLRLKQQCAVVKSVNQPNIISTS